MPRSIAAPVLLAMLVALPARAETLTILHTNDVHSRIEPISNFNNTCSADEDAAGACFGGTARLVAAVRSARDATDNSILVDAGDQFQGSLFYSLYKGAAAAETMKALDYDSMTVGNHEFDDGADVLRSFIDAVEFPVLLANADVSAEPALAGVLKPSTMIERAGEKIGLIGLAPADTAELASPGPNIRFFDPVEPVRRQVEELRADGVDRIIVLSHSGYLEDQRIAAAVDGIDVIVGGHSHTLLANAAEDAEEGAAGPYPTWVTTPDGGRTAIVQAYAYGKYLGRLDVTFDANGVIAQAVGEPILLGNGVAGDPAVSARIAELSKPLEEVRNLIVGEALAPIGAERADCRVRECAIGSLVAEAMLARVANQGIDIAIMNGGGLRAAIDAGPITMSEVLTVLPFQNTLATFQLTGAEIVEALESGVSQVEEGKGRFPQVAGLRYAYTPSAPANGGRILDAEVMQAGGWAPIDPAATYGVVSNDFLRRGGDGYVVFAEDAKNAYDFGPGLADVVAAYLTEHGSYQPSTDGRIAVE